MRIVETSVEDVMVLKLSEVELRRHEKRFLKEALESPGRRRDWRECAILMAYVVACFQKDKDGVRKEYRQTIADILVKDGEGGLQRLLSDLMPSEVQEARRKLHARLKEHASNRVGSC